jgi:hypothetical protein
MLPSRSWSHLPCLLVPQPAQETRHGWNTREREPRASRVLSPNALVTIQGNVSSSTCCMSHHSRTAVIEESPLPLTNETENRHLCMRAVLLERDIETYNWFMKSYEKTVTRTGHGQVPRAVPARELTKRTTFSGYGHMTNLPTRVARPRNFITRITHHSQPAYAHDPCAQGCARPDSAVPCIMSLPLTI